jgi:hypothetical protein
MLRLSSLHITATIIIITAGYHMVSNEANKKKSMTNHLSLVGVPNCDNKLVLPLKHHQKNEKLRSELMNV